MTRLSCFYIPMFALAARLRSEPELLEEAVAIVDGNGNNAHVVAATRRARKKGIPSGTERHFQALGVRRQASGEPDDTDAGRLTPDAHLAKAAIRAMESIGLPG